MHADATQHKALRRFVNRPLLPDPRLEKGTVDATSTPEARQKIWHMIHVA